VDAIIVNEASAKENAAKEVLAKCEMNRDRMEILAKVKEVAESSDMKEVAQMLHSGNWIAICATLTEPTVFCLGRINQSFQDGQANT